MVVIGVPRQAEKDEYFTVEWFKRQPWSDDPRKPAYKWSANPTFVPDVRAMERVQEQSAGGKKTAPKKRKQFDKFVATSKEPMGDFFPIEVRGGGWGSTHNFCTQC